MRDVLQFYIGGSWVDPLTSNIIPVVDPATEGVVGHVSLGSAADVDLAVRAARGAFSSWSRVSWSERLFLLEAISEEFRRRYDDVADAILSEMGAPLSLAKGAQTAIGLHHLEATIAALRAYRFSELRRDTLIVREPIGVCALITPWNWPINQIACKVAPAIAAGCTMVLKPSEIAPFSAVVWTEIMHAAGVPAGVFNLVNGEGSVVGEALASHPGVAMVSFTGSTGAGVQVAQIAARTVKRVHQELGGKSPHIILDDESLPAAVVRSVDGIALNAGQNCNAPTRMLVPRARLAEALLVAKQRAEALTVGAPRSDPDVGPVISGAHWGRIQELILGAIQDGATVVTGGPGKPENFDRGYFVKPTIFAGVTNEMTIAREEVFGPVLVVVAYDDLDDAVQIANDTPFGLAAYVSGEDTDTIRFIAAQLQAGQVNLNGAPVDYTAPFGGFKQSGNGREWGDHAIAEFLETKAVLGFATP
ncbi:aldehyde dehydrogenase family protein [Phenylobacterium sp. Root700]|uniref:aldehyde dehydrogenase family protein n=1 Tax=Phenylobacterium sp. Root700 TaxID=1736591 RepID=UPI0006FB349C|nr:aldehyde dehydrogenase family protein [Phenylobacterium sp. Root700]KRB52666.1 aldehyde dehydrogenase [Phenylobacterium sp. Root700]